MRNQSAAMNQFVLRCSQFIKVNIIISALKDAASLVYFVFPDHQSANGCVTLSSTERPGWCT